MTPKKKNLNQLKLNFNGSPSLKKSNPNYNSKIHSYFKKLYSEFNFFELRKKSFESLKKRYNNFSNKELKISEDAIKARLNILKNEAESFKRRKNSKPLTNQEKIYSLFINKLISSSTKLISLIESYKIVEKDYNEYQKNAESLKRSYLRASDKDAAMGIDATLEFYMNKKEKLQHSIITAHADYVTKYRILTENIEHIKKNFNIS